MTRTGKIARLPHSLRQQLNLRILDNEPGVNLVTWLNSLPEVQAILARDFPGRPITEQNLSEWKQGGFLEWRNHSQATASAVTLADYSRELTETVGTSPADFLSHVVAVQLARLLADISADDSADSAQTLRAISEVTKNLIALRRADQSSARIQLAEARIAVSGARAEEHIVHKFRDWMNRTNGWQFMLKESLSEEQRIARMTELLFGDRLPEDAIAQFVKDEPEEDEPEDSNVTPPDPNPSAQDQGN